MTEMWFVDPDDPCQDASCRRYNGKCIGMHCTYCGQPCSDQGHFDCYRRERDKDKEPEE